MVGQNGVGRQISGYTWWPINYTLSIYRQFQSWNDTVVYFLFQQPPYQLTNDFKIATCTENPFSDANSYPELLGWVRKSGGANALVRWAPIGQNSLMIRELWDERVASYSFMT